VDNRGQKIKTWTWTVGQLRVERSGSRTEIATNRSTRSVPVRSLSLRGEIGGRSGGSARVLLEFLDHSV
jgi:hypothetical protein